MKDNVIPFRRHNQIDPTPSHELEELFNWMKRASDAAVWALFLQRRAQFLLADELRFFFGDVHWLQAREVLELGLGPDTPMGSPRHIFPGKRFVQRTIDPGLVTEHAAELTGQLSEVARGAFDYAILRLVGEDAGDVLPLLAALRERLRVGGHLLVIDSHPPLVSFRPLLPTLRELKLQQAARRGGRPETLKAVAGALAELELKCVADKLAPAAAFRPDDKRGLAKMSLLESEIALRRHQLDVDQLRLSGELTGWIADEAGWGQLGLRFMLLEKPVTGA